MSIGAKAKIRLKFTNQKQINAVLEALTPEANSPLSHRGNVRFTRRRIVSCFVI